MNANERQLLVPGFACIRVHSRLVFLAFWLAGTLAVPRCVSAQSLDARSAASPAMIVEIEGRVEISRAGSQDWDPAHTNQVLRAGDRVRTGERSRAVLRLSNLSPYRMDERSVVQLPAEPKKRGFLELLRGAIYLLHRDKPGLFPIGTPVASAVIRGTEFHLEVAEDGTTRLLLLDGAVELTNEFGGLELQTERPLESGVPYGDAAVVEPGKAPQRTAVLNAANVIQWALYYPAIVDLDELQLSDRLKAELKTSLAAYREGDLMRALAEYPAARTAQSEDDRVYEATLLLAVGRVDDAEELLSKVDGTPPPVVNALRSLISTVKNTAGPRPVPRPSPLAAEWLAESYYQQSRHHLSTALEAARNAAAKSPNFGFAWARVAELEFSFGRTAKAREAVERALELTPRNAQALALKGFLLAAQNRISDAHSYFDRAIAVDGALANGWLGRGLCKLRRPPFGRDDTLRSGLEDLQTAAVLEPQRALLRSYLAKAFGNAGDNERAIHELELAKRHDTNDATAWLYSALVLQQQNRVNEAVRDLEHSQDLNENRSLYRSRLLLDQDRAVRGANLARMYDDVGLSDFSVFEASRAVNADYANFSAHLFLADSFQQQRDFRTANLRYETPAVNEYLLATLLAPVGAGTLAHSVSQQEYSKLFERDGFGVASSTEYLSRGAWVQSAAQYGTFGNSSYALSGYYHSDPGQRLNNDVERTELSVQVQQQFTPNDTAYFRAIYGDAKGGDLAQYYDPAAAYSAGGPNTLARFKEKQEPILLGGYRHEWAPGVQTLFLGGRLHDRFRVKDPQQAILLLERDAAEDVTSALPTTIEQNYRSELEIYTAELQQIWQATAHTVIVGARHQTGEIDSRNQHTNAAFLPFFFPQESRDFESHVSRTSVYAYENWQALDSLLFTAGVTYDRLTYPVNFRFAPLSGEEDTTERVLPKAGLIWTPHQRSTLRFGYSQSLGGVSFDQSFRLEPVQVAGFNQAYRSLIPESVAGANSAARFETFGLSLEQRLGRGTFLALGGEILESKVNRVLGAYDFTGLFSPFEPSDLRETLEYTERAVLVSAGQLLGRQWSVGARYRLSQVELDDKFHGVSPTVAGGLEREQDLEAVQHRLLISTIWNHPWGLFAEAQGFWYVQNSQGYSPDLASENFWQFNLFAGYRFAQRRAELRLGVLNLTDQDYRLNPLTLNSDLPRERTLYASLRFYF